MKAKLCLASFPMLVCFTAAAAVFAAEMPAGGTTRATTVRVVSKQPKVQGLFELLSRLASDDKEKGDHCGYYGVVGFVSDSSMLISTLDVQARIRAIDFDYLQALDVEQAGIWQRLNA